MSIRKTNFRQFEVTILGLRKPEIGEQFEIEVPPHLKRYEVECVDREGDKALVERLDDGPALSGVRSRVISDKKPRIVEERSPFHKYTKETLVDLRQERAQETLVELQQDGFRQALRRAWGYLENDADDFPHVEDDS